MARIDSRPAVRLLASTALAGTAFVALPVRAVELPTGGSVAHGQVSISTPSAHALAIQQSSSSAIVNWQGFSIGSGARVDISQPSASSALLNRVTGSTPSSIAGQLNANGQVYLVNPNGIVITREGSVKAGAFVASTLGITDEDFKAGRRTFTGAGNSAGIVNQGTIEIGAGGYAALLGSHVENSGVISVPMGRIGLGAGESATLDLSGDGFLQVAAPSRSPDDGRALIDQSGRLRAAGGRIELQAATARNAARNAINMSGIVEARSVGGRSGAIVLGGGAGGTVQVTGHLDTRAGARPSSTRMASGSSKAPRGGVITVTGGDIRLRGATLDASGPAGGGTIKVGGDLQGGGTLARAATTQVDAATRISADATASGNGGSVVVWSDQNTRFEGVISARGGPSGGDGGSAEVSGRATLSYNGQTDLSAPLGRFGTLLLDPFNVFITGGASSGTGFTATANDSVINATTLSNALATANVTVSTGGAGSAGAQAGDIAVQAPVAWNAATTLTLSAFHDITIGTTTGGRTYVTVPGGGGLVLRADNSGRGSGTVAFTSTDAGVGGGEVIANAGSTVSIFYNPADNPAGSAINATSYTTVDSFAVPANGPAGGVSGTGGVTAYRLVNSLADLQNIQNNRAGAYALGRDINATASATLNGGAGFVPIAQTGAAFTGLLEGQSQAISNLVINRPGESNVGLFGAVGGGTIRNVALVSERVQGGSTTGGLVGDLVSGTVQNIAALRGAIQGQTDVGGLVGRSNGTILSAGFAGVVGGVTDVGGLVGNQTGGLISNAGAQAQVTGVSNVGGLAGVASGSIQGAGTLGLVSGTTSVGGLVGATTNATIDNSNSESAASATGAATGAGGLVGIAQGTTAITRSFSTGSARGADAGGLVGELSGTAAISDSYSNAAVNGTSSGGGLIGRVLGDAGTGPNVARSYATGLVTGSAGATLGGIVGARIGTSTFSDSYQVTQTNGASNAAVPGISTLTVAQLQAALPSGFSPAVWGILPGQSFPYLRSRFPSGPLVASGTVLSANGTPLPGQTVSFLAGGAVPLVPGLPTRLAALVTALPTRTTTSAANGFYYVASDPLATGPQLATAALTGATAGSATTDAPVGPGAATGLDIRQGLTFIRTGLPTSSALLSRLNINGSIPAAGTAYRAPGGTALDLQSTNTSGFLVDQSLAADGRVRVTGAGTGVSAGPLTIGAGQSLQSTNSDVIVATTRFTNNGGATGIQAGGRFLVYSPDETNDARGGLTGGTLFGRSFAANPPEAITETGNQFVVSRTPVQPVPPNQDPATIAAVLASPTFSRQLPLTFTPANNLPDVFDLSVGGGSGGGPTLGTGLGSSGSVGRSAAAQTLSFVQRSSADLERRIAQCERLGGTRGAYTACVGSALDGFAQALDTRIVDLPAPLRNVTAVIRAAAATVRTAATIGEARAAVRNAISEVRKAIALIRADEPAVARLQVRQGNAIASALSSVDTRLARAVGL